MILEMQSACVLRLKREESREFRLIYLTAFAFFLVAAVVERLVPGRRAVSGRSVIAQARASAYTAIPFAFMG